MTLKSHHSALTSIVRTIFLIIFMAASPFSLLGGPSGEAKAGASKYLELPSGIKLRYQKAGSGEPLLLLHTIRTQLENFRDVIPQLSNRFAVYALDLPGHGYSSIDTSATYDEPYMRAVVVEFIKKLNLSGVTIAGESIGGTLALTVASELPGRVKAVIAINPYDYETRYADGVRRGNVFSNFILGSYQIPIVGAINAALENELFLGWVLEGGFFDPQKLSSDLLKEFDHVGHRTGYRYVERNVFANWRSWSDARQLYSQVTAPVTLVYGSHDWSRADELAQNKDAFPHARLIILKQTGHFASMENPNAIAQVILDAR